MKSKMSIIFLIFIFSLILWGSFSFVDAASISSCSVEGVNTQIYDGTPKKPSLKITFNSQKLIENTDYTLSYKNNTNVGTATVQITGKGKYSGSISKNFKILKVANLDNGNIYNILSSINQNRVLGTANSSTNNGSDILLSSINGSNSQKFKFVKNNDGSYCIKNASSGRVFDIYSGNTSVNFTKVWLYDSNNTKAQKWYPVKNSDGTYTFYTIDGTVLDVYTASTAINTKIEIYSSNSTPAQKFVLKCISSSSSGSSPTLVNISSCKIEDIATQTYDGTQKKPSLKITYNNKTLVENTDYALSYSNNINPGTASVKVTGKGNYTGTVTKNFTIKQKQESTDTGTNIFGSNKEYYILASQMKSRAVSTANSSFSNGTSIVLNTLSGGNAQKFKFVKNSDGSYCIINSHSGRALDVYAGKTSVNSTKVWLYDSNNTNAQKWYPIKNSDGTYSFYTIDGIALNLYYGRTDNNTKLEIYGKRSSSASQRFVLKDASTFTPANISTSSTFYILSKINTSKALDIYAGSKADHANVDIYNLNKTPAQKFKFVKNSDSTYTIVNVNSNKAVHILGNGSNNGTNVIQYSKFNSNAQKWYAFTNSDKSITFISCETGKALNLNGGNTNNFTTVNIWNWNENNAQKWVLEDISSVTLNKTSETMNLLDNSKNMTLKPTPSDASYEWSSKNPSVASVNSSGKVTAKSVGSTVITVKNKSNGKTASCTIKVIAIKFKTNYTSLTVGSKQTLQVDVYTPNLDSSDSSESLVGSSIQNNLPNNNESENNTENTNTDNEENKDSSETNTENTNTNNEENKESSETNTENTSTNNEENNESSKTNTENTNTENEENQESSETNTENTSTENGENQESSETNTENTSTNNEENKESSETNTENTSTENGENQESSETNTENTSTNNEENKESSETNTENTNTNNEENQESSDTNSENTNTNTDVTKETPKVEPSPSAPIKYTITSGSGIATLDSKSGELIFNKAGKITVTAENETYGSVSQIIEGKTKYLVSPYAINEKSKLELYSHLNGYQMQGFNISESGGVFYSIVNSYTKNETSTLFVKNNTISSRMKYYNFGHGSGFDTQYVELKNKNIIFTESVGYGTSSNYAISILNWHNGDTYNIATGNVKVNNKTISNLTGANFVYYTPNSKSNTTFNSKNGTYWKSIKVAVDDKYVLLYHSGYMYVYYLSDFMNVFNNPNNSKLVHNYTISTESTYYNINNQTISNAEVTIKAANIADFPLVTKPFKAAQKVEKGDGTALTYCWQGVSISGNYAYLIEGHRPYGASSYDTTKVDGKAFLNVYDITEGTLVERIKLKAFSDSNNSAIKSFSNNKGFKYKIEVEGIKIKKNADKSVDIYIGATGLENNSDKKNYIGVFKYHISDY